MDVKGIYVLVPLLLAAAGAAGVYLTQAPGLENSSPFAVTSSSTGAEKSSQADAAGLTIADMARRLDALEMQVQSLRAQLADQSVPGNTLDDSADVDAGPAASTASRPRESWHGQGSNGQVAAIATLAADLQQVGVEPWRAEEIVRRQSEAALASLELRDRGIREGLRGTPEYWQQMRELQDAAPSLRDEISTAQYDDYLFKTGQSNRVAVASVMLGSAAEAAGVQSGDILLAYANEPLFNYRDLRRSSTAGERGESVPLTVLRDGRELLLNLPRGPVGVNLSELSLDPDPDS